MAFLHCVLDTLLNSYGKAVILENSLINQPLNTYSSSTHGNQRAKDTIYLQQWCILHQWYLFYERKTTKDLMVPIKEAKSLHGSMAES